MPRICTFEGESSGNLGLLTTMMASGDTTGIPSLPLAIPPRFRMIWY